MTTDRIRALLRPRETRFFLAVATYGWLTAIVYWFLSYEWVGTVLLAALGLAATVIVVRLIRVSTRVDPSADRPFDEPLRLVPGASLAPLAMGFGLTACATATIFGIAVLAVGLLTVIWAGIAWVSASATELSVVADRDGRSVGHDGAPADPEGALDDGV